MATVAEFQQMLLTDPQARRDFAANPRKFLADNRLTMPEGVDLPDSIDLGLIEDQAARIDANMKESNSSLAILDANNVNEVTGFVAANVPVINRELDVAASVHDRLQSLPTPEDPAAMRATIAVIAAVVAAVVAVPVAVFGVSAPQVGSQLLPDSGIRRVTRGAAGLTLEGPGGLKVTGLTVDEVAQIIKTVRDS